MACAMRKIYYLNFGFLFAVKKVIGQGIVGKGLLVALLNCTVVLWLDSLPAFANEYQSKPDGPAFAILNPRKAPDIGALMLQRGDRLSGAVAKKQAYETYQIKKVFHEPEGQTNFEEAVKRTENERAQLIANIASEMKPVKYYIRIEAER